MIVEAPGATPRLERTLVRDLGGRVGDDVRVCGWAHAVGNGDATAPIILRDHTGLVHLIGPGGRQLAGHPGPVVRESAIEATGTVDGSGAGAGVVRIVLDRLRVLGPALGPPPVDEQASLEARLAWRHLDLRHPRNRLIFEVQTTVERAMREWWGRHGFLELHSPKFRAGPNMSGRELFTVDYFGRPAYLAQSPQFYKQMAMCAGFERVFEIGPVFRANPHVTARHDTEFVSVDVEMSWIESHEEVMAVEERWLRHVVATVEGDHGHEIARLFGRVVTVPDVPFPRVTMADARRMLARMGHRSAGPGAAEGDIDAEGDLVAGRARRRRARPRAGLRHRVPRRRPALLPHASGGRLEPHPGLRPAVERVAKSPPAPRGSTATTACRPRRAPTPRGSRSSSPTSTSSATAARPTADSVWASAGC